MVSPLLIVLLSLGEVVVTDWVDGRLIPTGAGSFGLADQVATGIEAATAYRAPAHLVALSQSGPAALAAAALLAASCHVAPSSLAFLGCQLEPRVAPTALQQALGHWPRDMLAASLTCEVAPSHPGAGRRVYPALFQLLAYGMASPGLYAEVQQGLLREIAAGQAGAYERQHGDLHSLLDVPGELFVEMLGWALDRSPWRGDGLVLAGAEHDVGRAARDAGVDPGGRRRRAGRPWPDARAGRGTCRRRDRSPYPMPAITTCSPAPAFSPAPHPSCAASMRDCPTRTAPASPPRG